MKRRRWMFIGFVFGYLWLWFKPFRRGTGRAVTKVMNEGLESFLKGAIFGVTSEMKRHGVNPLNRLKDALYGDEEPSDPLVRSIFDAAANPPDREPREVVFYTGTEGNAHRILDEMRDLMAERGTVTVADLYGITGTARGPARPEWYWKDLGDVRIEKKRDRWVITFPAPKADPMRIPYQRPTPGAKFVTAGIVLRSREEAELILEKMVEMIDLRKAVSVADLHDLVGFASTHVDNNVGWSTPGEISEGKISQVRDGFLLTLPAPKTIA